MRREENGGPAEERPSSRRYEPRSVNLKDKNNSHALIVELVGRNNIILEVGTSTGYLTRIFRDLGNRVIGIEIDEEAAEVAEGYCDLMITGDVEELDLDEYLGPSSIDVAVFGDLLEHLKYPSKLLKKIKRYLRPQGRIVVSIPNVCHGDVLISLLKGDFRYTSMGLLDETHLRFFGLKNVFDLLAGSGYSVEEVRTTRHPVGGTELRREPEEVPGEVRRFIEGLPNSDVYQFVLLARPSADPNIPPVPAADLRAIFDRAVEPLLREHEEPLRREVAEAMAKSQEASERVRVLSQDISERDGRIAGLLGDLEEARGRARSLDKAVSEREGRIAGLLGDLEEARERAKSLDQALSEREGRIAELSCELEEAGERAKSLDQAVSERDGRIGELDVKLMHSENRINYLGNEIEEMRRSVVWQLIMKFHNGFIEKALRQGTKRREYYNLGLKGCRIFVNEGPTDFWIKFSNYIKKSKINQIVLPTPIDETFCLNPSELESIDTLGKKKIAFVIHAYYVDLFEEICSYLRNVPVKYSLLISISKSDDKEKILKLIEMLSLVEHVEIKIVDNRGRDIAPMIVDFASSMSNFDYICHIHTKKSLYLGYEQSEWRRYIFDMLLGSKDRVKAILSVFEADPAVGIIYPETYYNLPYWGHTWLGNKGIAPELLGKLGIRFDPDEYIDFPASSMFWARKEALMPLLDLGIKSNDFPEEHGQLDGSLHHTIERTFVLAAQSRGFKYVVLLDKEIHLFSYKSSKNLHDYFCIPLETKIHKELQVVKVVSFDIFDTLLIRPFASPDMVFDFMEEKVAEDFGILGFRRIRKESENIARERKNYQEDVNISEIYSVFAEQAKIKPSIADKLLELEVSTEIGLLIPRDDVIKIAKGVKGIGKRVILVSDMYLQQKNVEKILLTKGIDFYDDIYISCEIGRRKDRGDMWDYVLTREGVTKNEFLNIGDNEESDIHLLADRGFTHLVHIMRPSVLFRLTGLGEALWGELKPYNGWRYNLLYGMIANYFCSDPYPKEFFDSREPLSDPFSFGYTVFGPIVFSFISWLIKVSSTDDVKKLKFISREGFLLNRALQIITTHQSINNGDIELPDGSYFLCSRRATIFAALRNEEDIPRLLDRHFQGTLRAFFEKRLNVSRMDAIENRLGKNELDTVVFLPRDYNKIYEHVIKVFDILAEQAETEREAFLQYCTEQGIDGSKKIGLVDVGYSASIQKAMNSMLGIPLAGYYFVTDEMASSLKLSGSICRAYFGDFVDPLNSHIPIQRYSLLMESVLTAPDGQLLYFQSGSQGVKPIFKEHGISQRNFSTIFQIHEGSLKFVKDMLDSFGRDALDIDFPKDIIQRCYEMVINNRIEIGNLKLVLSVEDQFCGNEEISPLEFYKK